jgi:hypothetical protein
MGNDSPESATAQGRRYRGGREAAAIYEAFFARAAVNCA